MDSSGDITNLESFIKTILELKSQFKGQIWWRGQRDFSWKLKPSIYREDVWAKSERSFVARFQHKAPSRHPKVPPYEDHASWLFLMQHYRLPTRLLDWTESPLIACFFAVDRDKAVEDHLNTISDSDGAIFALSPFRLNKDQIGLNALLLPDDPKAIAIIERAFSSTRQNVKSVVAIRPSEVDLRLTVQLSVFTLHGAKLELDEFSNSPTFLRKFRIPAKAKGPLKEELKYLGVRESSIFPDLEHLANDVVGTQFAEITIPRLKYHTTIQKSPRDPEPTT